MIEVTCGICGEKSEVSCPNDIYGYYEKIGKEWMCNKCKKKVIEIAKREAAKKS